MARKSLQKAPELVWRSVRRVQVRTSPYYSDWPSSTDEDESETLNDDDLNSSEEYESDDEYQEEDEVAFEPAQENNNNGDVNHMTRLDALLMDIIKNMPKQRTKAQRATKRKDNRLIRGENRSVPCFACVHSAARGKSLGVCSHHNKEGEQCFSCVLHSKVCVDVPLVLLPFAEFLLLCRKEDLNSGGGDGNADAKCAVRSAVTEKAVHAWKVGVELYRNHAFDGLVIRERRKGEQPQELVTTGRERKKSTLKTLSKKRGRFDEKEERPVKRRRAKHSK